MDMHIKNLRIFSQVMQDGSFSQAARSLDITQPTVSQQILRLEADLGVTLFERAGHDLIQTEAAREFFEYAKNILEQTDQFNENFSQKLKQPKGLVRYAMPESCQWTPHFRRIMAQLKDSPDLQFDIEIASSKKIVEGLLNGYFDFGFIAGEKVTPELRFEKFSDETYTCVASSDEIFEPLRQNKKEECRFISFEGWEIFFSAWTADQGFKKLFENGMQRPPVKISTLSGAIHAAREGAGMIVAPLHCVADEIRSGLLREYRGKPNKASQPIYLCRKIGSKKPARVDYVVEQLKKAKKELG
jgi:DNA-binding transcriptional LysR family regulator